MRMIHASCPCLMIHAHFNYPASWVSHSQDAVTLHIQVFHLKISQMCVCTGLCAIQKHLVQHVLHVLLLLLYIISSSCSFFLAQCTSTCMYSCSLLITFAYYFFLIFSARSWHILNMLMCVTWVSSCSFMLKKRKVSLSVDGLAGWQARKFFELSPQGLEWAPVHVVLQKRKRGQGWQVYPCTCEWPEWVPVHLADRCPHVACVTWVSTCTFMLQKKSHSVQCIHTLWCTLAGGIWCVWKTYMHYYSMYYMYSYWCCAVGIYICVHILLVQCTGTHSVLPTNKGGKTGGWRVCKLGNTNFIGTLLIVPSRNTLPWTWQHTFYGHQKKQNKNPVLVRTHTLTEKLM
jgi:hypothetical protein